MRLPHPVARSAIDGLKSGFGEATLRRQQSQIARIPGLCTRGGRKILRSPRESFLILRMAVWVFILSILVRLQPLPRALRMVAAKTQAGSQSSDQDTEKVLGRAIDLLLGTDLLIFKPVCWKRAAILHRYLALNGIATQIVFGVRKGTDGAIDGHAWLESDGKPVLEVTAPDYIVTYTFPSKEHFNLDLGTITD